MRTAMTHQTEPERERSEEETIRYKKRRRIVSALSMAVLVLLTLLLTVIVGRPLISSIEDPKGFQSMVQEYGVNGRLFMIGLVALQVIVATIPGEPIELAAGYAFGAAEGCILCLAGAAIGTCIIYLFTKKLGIRLVEAFISREKIASLKFIRTSRRLNLLVAVLYLIPGTPKDIITYFVGLTPINLPVLLVISTFARIPSVVSSTITGSALFVGEYTLAILCYGITGLFSLAGILLYRHIAKTEAI
jgi:uncharacterized membrane protein YdjX (TVP38/TMEM64 family)